MKIGRDWREAEDKDVGPRDTTSFRPGGSLGAKGRKEEEETGRKSELVRGGVSKGGGMVCDKESGEERGGEGDLDMVDVVEASLNGGGMV